MLNGLLTLRALDRLRTDPLLKMFVSPHLLRDEHLRGPMML